MVRLAHIQIHRSYIANTKVTHSYATRKGFIANFNTEGEVKINNVIRNINVIRSNKVPPKWIKSSDGSIMPMVILFTVLSIAFIITVTNASSLYLEKKRILSVADGGSLAAAEGFDLSQLSYNNGSLKQVLSNDKVGEILQEYASRVARKERLDDLRIESFYSDGSGVGVTLSAHWTPPLLSALFPNSMRISASSYARGRFFDE